jgi:hypothetical protein
MSDINISDKLVDKLTEALNKSVKKTLFFEKIEKIESIAIGFGLCISFISIITMYNFYSINNIKQIINNNNESKNESNNESNNKSKNEYEETSIISDEYTAVKEIAEIIFSYY